MKTDKLTGLIYIAQGRINIESLKDGDIDIKTKIHQLLALRDLIQDALLWHERDVQASFKPKLENKQVDLEDAIKQMEDGN